MTSRSRHILRPFLGVALVVFALIASSCEAEQTAGDGPNAGAEAATDVAIASRPPAVRDVVAADARLAQIKTEMGNTRRNLAQDEFVDAEPAEPVELAELRSQLERLRHALDSTALRSLAVDDPALTPLAEAVEDLAADVDDLLVTLDNPTTVDEYLRALHQFDQGLDSWEVLMAEVETQWQRLVAQWEGEWKQATVDWELAWATAVADWQRDWEAAIAEWEARWSAAVEDWERNWAEAIARWEAHWAEAAAEWEADWAAAAAEWERRWADAAARWEAERARGRSDSGAGG